MIRHLLLLLFPLLLFNTSDPAADDAAYYIDNSTWKIRSMIDGSTDKIALITIDDGPKAFTTPKFLDLLDKYDAKALFFVNGYLAEPLPWVVKKIIDRGHEVGNHSWHHKRLDTLSPQKAEEEILKMNRWLKSEMNYTPRFFRAPYGVNTPHTLSVLQKNGLENMNWSAQSYDWLYTDDKEQISKNAAEIARRTLSSMNDGNIILIHDRAVSVAALDIILKKLTERGYRFVLPSREIPPAEEPTAFPVSINFSPFEPFRVGEAHPMK